MQQKVLISEKYLKIRDFGNKSGHFGNSGTWGPFRERVPEIPERLAALLFPI